MWEFSRLKVIRHKYIIIVPPPLISKECRYGMRYFVGVTSVVLDRISDSSLNILSES